MNIVIHCLGRPGTCCQLCGLLFLYVLPCCSILCLLPSATGVMNVIDAADAAEGEPP